MKNFLQFLRSFLPNMLILATITLIIGFFLSLCIWIETFEISLNQYNEIYNAQKEYPQLVPLIQEALGDDKISHSEYDAIMAAKRKIYAKQLKQEIKVPFKKFPQ
jgi:hypothetical protein